MRPVVPSVLVLTDRSQVPPWRTLTDTIAAALRGGADGVLLRERDLRDSERHALAADVADLTAAHGAALILANPRVHGIPDAGLHLRAADPLPDERPHLLGRSCHDLDEVRRARDEGCDYISASPFAATESKPGHGPALGPDGLARLVEVADGTPVLALGGITPETTPDLRSTGVHGVAVMGAVMRSADPESTAAALLDVLRGA